MALRMVPLKRTFRHMSRLVRDEAMRAGKAVELEIRGEDIELDRALVDGLLEPLVHLLRNAIDHGLEASPEAREAAGKAARGRLRLEAVHEGGAVFVEVADDGRGLDLDAIRRKAEGLGIATEPGLGGGSDDALARLIFAPGLSTAAWVTETSGRGVGLDAVHRACDALRAHVSVTTTPGRGTAFRIALPQTLAVIDGICARVGDERYIVPTHAIVRSLTPEQGALTSIFHRDRLCRVDEQLVPVFRLSELLGVGHRGDDDPHPIIVVVEAQGQRVGLAIDELIGKQQVVIKALGQVVTRMAGPGIAGGAILPDGEVGLVLDIPGVVRLAEDARAVTPETRRAS
jgi:two-component system chemotaxis sensor kinase CheA